MESYRRNWNNWLVAAVVALAMAVLSRGNARAECGDYVQIGDGHSVAHHSNKVDSKSTPKPCDGPGCSRHRPDPLVPPATPPSAGAGEWVCLFVGQANHSPDQSSRLATSNPARPIRRANSIFHPPRFNG